MRDLVIIYTENCAGSERLRRILAPVDWPAMGVHLCWQLFDPADRLVQANRIMSTPTGLLDGTICFVGIPDLSHLLRKLAPCE